MSRTWHHVRRRDRFSSADDAHRQPPRRLRLRALDPQVIERALAGFSLEDVAPGIPGRA